MTKDSFQGEAIEEATAESEAGALGGHQVPHGQHVPHGHHPGGLPGHQGHHQGQAAQGHQGHHGHSHEEEDSGCECGLEELEGEIVLSLETFFLAWTRGRPLSEA